MKIAYFVDTFLPETNGVAISLDRRTKLLAQRGHDVLIVCPKYSKKDPVLEDRSTKRVFSVPFPTYRHVRIAFPLRGITKKVREFDPDVIHVEGYGPVFSKGIKVAQRLNKPLVGTFHTLLFHKKYLRHAYLHWIPGIEKLGWWTNNRYFNRCNLVSAPSKYTLDELKKNKLRVDTRVISNGIDVEVWQKPYDRNKTKKRFNLGEKNVVFVGRLAREKSVDVLLRAFAKIADNKTKLVLVGDGPSRSHLEQLAKKLNVSDQVVFAGMVLNEELTKSGLLQCADVFATASKTETQGLSALEAQAAGLPVVCVNEQAVQELVDDKNGFVVQADAVDEFSRALAVLLSDDALRKNCAAHAHRSAEKHALSFVVDEWESVYGEVMQCYQS